MIKLITETYNDDNEIVLRIEYNDDKELELKTLIRDYIQKIKKDNENDKELEWNLIELSLDITLFLTNEKVNEIKNRINKIKEKIDNEKVKNLENTILALIEMKQHWQHFKEKVKEKLKIFDFGDIIYIHL
jgi:predicted membrane metal-binding protein